MEDGTSSGETHDLLLALAGRVDDDLLGRARELVAVGEDARAVELVTASLVAARALLPEPVRSALVAAARTARTGLDPAAALPRARPEGGTEHRFTPPADDDPVAGVLLALPARALAGCRVLLTRRRTPAGSAPGPVPHPVVLVEAPAGGRPTEVLAYQIAVALERAGLCASVEVLAAGSAPSDYHATALRSAVPVITADGAESALADRARPAPWRDVRRPEPRPRSRPEPDPEPEPEPEEQVSPRRRVPDTAALLGPPLHSDEPLDGLLSSVRPIERPEPERAEPERAEPEHPEQERAEREDPEPARPEPERPEPERPELERHPQPAAVVEDVEDAQPGRRRLLEREPPAPETPVREQALSPLETRPQPRPAPRPVPSPTGRIRRPTVTPISRASVPNPIPLVRRNGPAPIVRPIAPVEPEREIEPQAEQRVEDAVEETIEAATTEAATTEVAPRESAPRQERRHADAEAGTPSGDPRDDPLNDPLNQPLLDPLLDPTTREDDLLGAAERLPADGAPEPAADDEEWSAEWLSGTWAMAPSALHESPRERDRVREEVPGPERVTAFESEFEPELDAGPADEPDETPAAEELFLPPPAPRRPARHRYADEPEQPADPAPVAEEPDHPRTAPEPPSHRDPEPENGALGLRPESVARLSEADRALLARLQAELLEGRKPRAGRRAGFGSNAVSPSGNNGSTHNNGNSHNNGNHRNNGRSHRSDPPDLAG